MHLLFYGGDGEIRPPHFCVRRHAPGHRNSPPDCFYASHCPFRISHYIKNRCTKVHLLFYGGDGEIRPPHFCVRRHAPGHRNSPPDCFYASHCPFRISHYIKNRCTKVHLLFYGGDGEIRPPHFCVRRHAPGHRNSPPDCFYASHCPFRISHYIKNRCTKVHLLFYGGDGEIRTRGGLLPN